MRKSTNFIVACFVIALIGTNLKAQLLKTPMVSPEALVNQKVGVSTVKIHYHRPAVKEREIWGKLVPFGMTTSNFGNGNPAPWRAGANENTTITFSDDAMVEGHPVKAGTYGLFMIVDPDEWTLILSSNSTSWGSFFYDEKEDVLRVKLLPEVANYKEWLEYGFDNPTLTSTTAWLHWERVKVPFKIEFDTDNLAIKDIDNQLRNTAGFAWQGWNQAAFYCLQNNTHLEKGEEWVKKSISMNENETNRNIYAYVLMAQNKTEEAMNIFKENVKKYPESWNVRDSMGEAYKNIGDKKNAIKMYKKALSMAPENQKERIQKILDDLNS
jgi:tetratricopeptide (TPR) repeat protein